LASGLPITEAHFPVPGLRLAYCLWTTDTRYRLSSVGLTTLGQPCFEVGTTLRVVRRASRDGGLGEPALPDAESKVERGRSILPTPTLSTHPELYTRYSILPGLLLPYGV